MTSLEDLAADCSRIMVQLRQSLSCQRWCTSD